MLMMSIRSCLLIFIVVVIISQANGRRENQCRNHYCANGGNCIIKYSKCKGVGKGVPSCKCAGSWTGPRCDDDPCKLTSCKENEICLMTRDGTAKCIVEECSTAGMVCKDPDFLQSKCSDTIVTGFCETECDDSDVIPAEKKCGDGTRCCRKSVRKEIHGC